MTVLRPPTDNLYKFVAVSGLVLVVASILIPLREYDDYDRAIWESLPAARAASEASTKNFDAAMEEASPREEGRSPVLTEAERKRLEAESEAASERLTNVQLRFRAIEARLGR